MAAPFIHGEGHNRKTKLYRVWNGMNERCYTRTCHAFKDYGGRGIKVCTRWRRDYLEFKRFALNNGYAPGLHIDRIDNDGDYEPGNIRFVEPKFNMRNRRSTKLTMEIADKIRSEAARGKYSQREIGKKFGITQGMVGFIVRRERWA